MKLSLRVLSLLSLAFGLVATGALSLAVATDYWLFTTEPMPLSEMAPDPSMLENLAGANPEGEMPELPPDYFDDIQTAMPFGTAPPMDIDYIVSINVHSGLWRFCLQQEAEEGDEYPSGKLTHSVDSLRAILSCLI